MTMETINPIEVRLPFEQQPNEGDKAFAAFSLYLGLGPQRSLTVVPNVITARTLKASRKGKNIKRFVSKKSLYADLGL